MLDGENSQRTLDEPTQKLFKAIDDENLEDFKQALAEGADVNAFDEGGPDTFDVYCQRLRCQR